MRTIRLVVLTALAAVVGVMGVTDASAKTKPHRAPRTVELRTPTSVRSVNPLAVYTNAGDTAPATVLEPVTTFGSRRVLLATAKRGSWYRVSLPTRPNGSSAWVRKGDDERRIVHDQIRVDLASHTLTWLRDGVVVLTTEIAIGAPDTPTPTGSFYVTDLLDNENDNGAYGPFALGLSAHSDTLSEFAGGDGQIGMHGTNEPWSIGQSVSHGCVRVPNDVITQLATSLSLGTPVTIT
jgi:lipoprotein-anchoring transpeptidase ErfK/SrfK